MLLGLLFLGSSRYGDYITYECPQAEYACPKICDVDHKHYKKDRDCSFMKELVSKKKTKEIKYTKTYKHLDEEIEVEWISSYFFEGY